MSRGAADWLCSTCAAWKRVDVPSAEQLGECRRRAPVPVVRAAGTPEDAQQVLEPVTWPLVPGDGGCAEWMSGPMSLGTETAFSEWYP